MKMSHKAGPVRQRLLRRWSSALPGLIERIHRVFQEFLTIRVGRRLRRSIIQTRYQSLLPEQDILLFHVSNSLRSPFSFELLIHLPNVMYPILFPDGSVNQRVLSDPVVIPDTPLLYAGGANSVMMPSEVIRPI